MTFVNIQKRGKNAFLCFFYYAKDIIAIIIITESVCQAYVRREGNGSFKSPALEIIQ